MLLPFVRKRQKESRTLLNCFMRFVCVYVCKHWMPHQGHVWPKIGQSIFNWRYIVAAHNFPQLITFKDRSVFITFVEFLADTHPLYRLTRFTIDNKIEKVNETARILPMLCIHIKHVITVSFQINWWQNNPRLDFYGINFDVFSLNVSTASAT